MVRTSRDDWHPGKGSVRNAGRKPVYSEHQRKDVARVAMSLKRKLRRVRARLPAIVGNPETGMPMNDKTIERIFSTFCYDKDEEDPWRC